MALTPRLEVRQAQSLTLTPQLMQSIRLLQLSHLELSAFVETELERNPLLEREEGADNGEGGEPAEAPAELSAYEDIASRVEHMPSADAIADGYDTAVENVFPEQVGQDAPSLGSNWSEGSAGAGEGADLDQFVSSRPSLGDHLQAQVNMMLADAGERMIARHLIDGLNEAGYLAIELSMVAEQLGASVEQVEAVLRKVQGCDPAGIFARSVPECLALQLAEKNRLDPMMQALLDNLELIASHDMAGLMRVIGCDREDLADMLAELRSLDPKPGRAFDNATVDAIVPDVFVREASDGGWAVELNSDVLPRVLVNRVYYATITRRTRDVEEKNFLVDCLQTANWLAKSLDQRAQTILKVATEIVRQQDGFLVHGVSHLKPMTLKMVAEAIEMHESTVSRVTSNKYLSTPRGLFEMKYFFTTALGSTDGQADHSAEAVRHRIKQLIDAETAKDVLSDDTIADILKREQGIDVARRTVAKYREGMNIPSSVLRRRQKKALAEAP